MKAEQDHVSIVILNWNGWQDTIECLETVLKSEYRNYHIILIDNFSEDDSVSRIKKWASGQYTPNIETNFPHLVFPLFPKPVYLYEVLLDDMEESPNLRSLPPKIPARSIVLIRSVENNGFAIANNIGIKIADKLFYNKYYYLLNNDTVIEQDSISGLVETMRQNPDIGVVTSAIYHYSDPKKIVNLGGKLTFLARRKYYTSLRYKRRVSFVTGCALLIRKKIFDNFGLLSGKFFFGEEDIEFSWRLHDRNVNMDCLSTSRVYHKIGVSSNKLYDNNLLKQFIYLFTRIVNMRDNFNPIIWQIWRHIIMLATFFWLILKFGINPKKALKFVCLLKSYSNIYFDAKKTTIERIYQEIRI